MTKVPPLKCPVAECGSFRVHKNRAGSIVCDECKIVSTVHGNQKKYDIDPQWLIRRNTERKSNAERAKIKNDID